MTAASLPDASASFAEEVQDTLDRVLPGERRIVSTGIEGSARFVVGPDGDAASRGIPLSVDAEVLATLRISFFLALDSSGRYLKAVRSAFVINSVLDRTPLLRLEYDATSRSAPVAHWQVHAERGAFSHVLARAHAKDATRVRRPHDLSSLHLPVGGERFRPCLEDLLQFLVVDCGVDCVDGWQQAIREGRRDWRRRQLGSAVRDLPLEAARVLTELGWEVSSADDGMVENVAALERW